MAFLLVTQSIHVAHGALLVAGGGALTVLALTADGPLGVRRMCSGRLHRLLVVVVAGALALCCLAPRIRPDGEGLLVIAVAVVALVVLASRTTVSADAGGRRRRVADRGEIVDVTATRAAVTPTVPPPASPPPPPPPSTGDAVARSAGRAAAAAAATGRRVVGDHRPQVEDHGEGGPCAGAGRLAGRRAGLGPASRRPEAAGSSTRGIGTSRR